MCLAALCMSLLPCLGTPIAVPGEGPWRAQDVGDRVVSIHLEDVDIRTALHRLFGGIAVGYTLAPEIRGSVTLELRSVRFETALANILYQVNGRFRVEDGIYELVSSKSIRGDPSPDNGYRRMPEFRPGRYSGSYEVQNKGLFLTPHRSLGGTYDLLSEAAAAAGFDESFAYRYSENGFAMVLPLEALQPGGQPQIHSDRFRLHPKMSPLDFRTVGDTWQAAGGPSTACYRVLVLLVTSERISADGSPNPEVYLRPSGETGLPEFVRKRTWAKDPKLTVLVYEFRRKGRSVNPVLLKQGESWIAAGAHVVSSGLWSETQLR